MGFDGKGIVSTTMNYFREKGGGSTRFRVNDGERGVRRGFISLRSPEGNQLSVAFSASLSIPSLSLERYHATAGICVIDLYNSARLMQASTSVGLVSSGKQVSQGENCPGQWCQWVVPDERERDSEGYLAMMNGLLHPFLAET